MCDIILHYKNELMMRVECSPSTAYEISEAFSFFVNGYKWMPAFKAGRWDGKIRLFNIKDRQFYIGLVEDLKVWCKENGYTLGFAEGENFMQSDLALGEGDWETIKSYGKFVPKWYQENAIKYACEAAKSLILSPTGSGKSYILYLMVRHILSRLDGDILIVVPSTSLVEQLMADFKDYVADGWDADEFVHLLYGGKDKSAIKRVTICTWQTAKGMPAAWFKRFQAYLCDEAHEADSKCQSEIITKIAHAPVRMGLTGTLDGTTMHLLEMKARFGAVFRAATTKDLQDGGDLSKLKIDCLHLKYTPEEIDMVRHLDYQGEIDFIVSHKKRNFLLAQAALKSDGNVLMLFNYVERHGKVLYDLLEPLAEKHGKKVYFISGGVDVEEREEIRMILERESNCILLASFGTTKRGINFKNLDNLIFCHPYKAVITILQSIGRALRVSTIKEYATLIDVADDLTHTKRNGGKIQNTTLKHFLERLKVYVSEGWKYKIIPIKM